MKKLLIVIAAAALLSGCNNGDGKTITRLTDQQRNFLNIISTNAILTFNDNQQMRSVVIGQTVINEVFEEEKRGGMFSPAPTYYHEEGQRVCKNIKNTDEFSLTFYAHAKMAYDQYFNSAYQSIVITNEDSSSVAYNIDDFQTLPLKTIGSKQYHDVVYAVAKQDTLFWKENTSVLGWTNTGKGYTTYRVY